MQNLRSISLSEILSSSSELSDYVGFLDSQVGTSGQEDIPMHHLAVLTAWTGYEFVARGGLGLYYANCDDPSKVALAFRQLGLGEAATEMEKSTSVFPAGMIEAYSPMFDAHWQERIGWMYDREEELNTSWQGQEEIIKALGQPSPENNGTVLEAQTRQFIMEHLGAFEFTS